MTDDIYEQLADALNRLPNGFPRTPSNVEVRILKKIIAPQEAALVVQLSGQMEPIDVIAARLGLPVSEAMGSMIQMARRGLAWYEKQAGKHCFRLAPFVVGIYEAQLDRMDHELAHMVEEFMATGGAVGMMSPQPAIHRVVPAQSAIKSEWILPYDDVRAILLASKTFRVRDCICRAQQEQLDHPCSFPKRICLNFSTLASAHPGRYFPARSAGAFGQGRRGGAGSYSQQRDEGNRVRLQLLQWLLRDHARHHQVGHRKLGRPRQLLRGD